MQQILIATAPRTTQTVELDGIFFDIKLDYSQNPDTWLISIQNTETGVSVEGLPIRPMRPALYHHRTLLGISGDILALPTGVSGKMAPNGEAIGYTALTERQYGLYYITPDEVL